jgi:hypothetical protein
MTPRTLPIQMSSTSADFNDVLKLNFKYNNKFQRDGAINC